MSSAGNATVTYLIQNMSSSSIKMDMIYRKVIIFNNNHNNHIYNPLIQFDRVYLLFSNYSNIRYLTCVADDYF